MKKVLLRFYDKNNLGDDLFIKVITERYKNEFSVIASQPNPFLEQVANLAIFRNKILFYALKAIEKALGVRNIWLRQLVARNDLLVYIGGSLFIEGNSPKKWVKELDFYRNCKIPYYILGSNFGPYSTKEFKNVVTGIFDGAKDVCFRDSESYRLFEGCRSVRLATDIAFSLNMTNLVIKSEKHAVFSLIDCHDRFAQDLANSYDSQVRIMTERLLTEGYRVTYMSFCESEGDERAIEQIKAGLDEKIAERVETFCYKGDLNEALAFLASCEVVIATRFHAAILGLLFKKKVLPVIYSDKTANILRDMSFDGPVVDVRRMGEFDAATIKFSELIEYDVRDQIDLAEEQFAKLDEVLVKRKS